MEKPTIIYVNDSNGVSCTVAGGYSTQDALENLDRRLTALEKRVEPTPEKLPGCPRCGASVVASEFGCLANHWWMGCIKSGHPSVFGSKRDQLSTHWRALCRGWKE